MKWWFIGSHSEWKSHYFPDVLKEKVLQNLEERGMDFPPPDSMLALKETQTVCMDVGGMCMADESWVDYELAEGVTFSIPVSQVVDFRYKFGKCQERLELGIPYFKIHAAWHCLCILPEDRDALISQIEQRFEETSALAELENQRFNLGLEKLKDRANVIVTDRPVKREKIDA